MPRAAAFILLVAVLTTGCRAPEPGYPQDPLFQNKQPIEKVASPSTPILFAAVNDPHAPPFPTYALAAPKQPTRTVQTTNHQPVQHTPARVATVDPARAYGHALDFSWLQGVLERQSDGTCELRYAQGSEADSGKVVLDDDPQLAGFADGAMVRV